jgi:hypothetical protein
MKIIISEKMESQLIDLLIEDSIYYPEPDKVLLIKKYLDNNFAKASVDEVSPEGYPIDVPMVGMKNSAGQPVKNMTDKQLFYFLQDKFKDILSDKSKRDKFIIQVMKDWYNNKITKDGVLSNMMIK